MITDLLGWLNRLGKFPLDNGGVIEKVCPKCGNPVYFEVHYDEIHGNISGITLLNSVTHRHCGLSEDELKWLTE